MDSTGSGCGADCAQTDHCGPHLHKSACGTAGNVMLLFGAGLPRTIGWGIAACFGGVSSALGLYIFWMADAGLSFLLDGIGHDLVINKFIEAGTVLGHGVSSLVDGMAGMAVAGALGTRGASCSSIGGLLWMGISMPSFPWGFCIKEQGISWIFALGTSYIVNGVG